MFTAFRLIFITAGLIVVISDQGGDFDVDDHDDWDDDYDFDFDHRDGIPKSNEVCEATPIIRKLT